MTAEQKLQKLRQKLHKDIAEDIESARLVAMDGGTWDSSTRRYAEEILRMIS